MLHRISFESSYSENGDTAKIQKNEWGFISQILEANFSKSARFKSFLLPLRIGRSKGSLKKIQPNLTMKFSDTGVRIFLAKIFGPPKLGNDMRQDRRVWALVLDPKRLRYDVETEAKKLREKNFFFEIFFFSDPIFLPSHDPKEL
jgi:hypothetical protein